MNSPINYVVSASRQKKSVGSWLMNEFHESTFNPDLIHLNNLIMYRFILLESNIDVFSE